MAEEKLDAAQVQAAVQRAGAQWEAGVTSVSELSRADQVKRLGAAPPPGELSLEQVEQQVRDRARLPAIAERAIGAPAAFDLRNVGGKNFITPIRDQGGCGSCVAFGTCATIEGTFRWQRGDPNLQVDLSEAQLFYCHGRAQGRNCSNGWWPDQALECCKNPGVADEACYPYTAGDQNCTNLCSDWQNRVIKIQGYHRVNATADMKTWISTRGPLCTCFIVYADFFNYRSGIYRHVTGNQVGGHCVSMVGYDDTTSSWICKNSWGTGWGESGFFRIAYGDSGIDSWLVSAVDGIEETGWLANRKVLGLWAIDQDRNAWVYLDGGIGWRKIAFDTDNIFFDLLTQLTTAKAANRPVNIYQEQGVVKQIYVF